MTSIDEPAHPTLREVSAKWDGISLLYGAFLIGRLYKLCLRLVNQPIADFLYSLGSNGVEL